MFDQFPTTRSKKWKVLSLFMVFSFLLITKIGIAQQGNEFSGPFDSWANVIQRFGAKGDGKSDDTRALQMALDSFSVRSKGYNTGPRAYSVIYLPAGTYRITAPLTLQGKIGVSIIGESPSKTSIVYDGRDGHPMLWANGSAYFKVSRITWNANKKRNITCIALQWKSKWDNAKSQSFASVNIEISDSYFTGEPYYGIQGGTHQSNSATGANDSEVAIQRCTFIACTFAGIKIEGYNALDYWIWDCKFDKCKRGIDNTQGNYHAYRCFFNQSYDTDIINDNGYYTSVRGCYSYNSNCFSHDQGISCNPFKRIFQGNIVQGIKGNNIYFAHLGKVTLIDNVFTKGSKVDGAYALNYGSWCRGIYEVMSVGNNFGLKVPFKIDAGPKIVHSISDQNGFPEQNKYSASSTFAIQEEIPETVDRRKIDISLNLSSDEIQRVIFAASDLKGQRTILHFGWGTYIIDKPLIIPSNSDIQIIGDGLIYASVLVKGKNFPKDKPLIQINGPTNISLRDIQLLEHGGDPRVPAAIAFVNVDQPGGEVVIDQLHTTSSNALHLIGTDFLYVQKQNSFFSSGNKVSGGPLSRQGKASGGLYCFGGQFAGCQVEGNGTFIAKDCWWEGPTRLPINIQGSGNITLDGIMVAPVNADSNATVKIGKFDGKISVLNAYIQGALTVEGKNPSLKFLVWNTHFYHKMRPLAFVTTGSSYQAAFLGLSAQCFDSGKPACAEIISIDDKFINVQKQQSFILESLALDRAAVPRRFVQHRSGTSVFISRISIGSCETAITFSK